MKSVMRSKMVLFQVACLAAGSALLVRVSTSSAANDGALSSGIAPTSQPAATARTIQEIIPEYSATTKELATILPRGATSDPDKRKAAAPQAIPVLAHRLQLLDEMAATKKVSPVQLNQLRLESQSLLYLMNDSATVTHVQEMAQSKDLPRQAEGQSVQLYAAWMSTGENKDDANKVIDGVEKLDRAQPDNTKLTMLTLDLANSARTPEAKSRLFSFVTDIMTDPYAKRMKAQLAAQQAAQAKQAALVDKPMTLAAKTVEGKDFTTADLKGKVVLVDFWATWCGPCKAGLPHVKEIYSQYHDKGLEIVGVSNDYAAEDLQDFTPKNNMPWPQLFDVDAAADHKWNPLSEYYGVTGIPCMFLIDKKGVCRSITAREDMDTLIPKLLAE